MHPYSSKLLVVGCISGRLGEKQSKSSQKRYFDHNQISLLKQYFAQDPYPKQDTLKSLSDMLGVHKMKVYNWFYRKRAKSTRNKL